MSWAASATHVSARQKRSRFAATSSGASPGYAVAAVSDAAYRLCGGILPAAYKDYQALVVPYSLLAPFVLMIYEQHRRSGVDLDAAQQAQALADAETHLKRATDELNGRMSNAMTQFRN